MIAGKQILKGLPSPYSISTSSANNNPSSSHPLDAKSELTLTNIRTWRNPCWENPHIKAP
jgi:hypothetical protein